MLYKKRTNVSSLFCRLRHLGRSRHGWITVYFFIRNVLTFLLFFLVDFIIYHGMVGKTLDYFVFLIRNVLTFLLFFLLDFIIYQGMVGKTLDYFVFLIRNVLTFLLFFLVGFNSQEDHGCVTWPIC